MAKADKFGGGLGKKPATPAPAAGTDIRENTISLRLQAFNKAVEALQPLNTIERTQVVAAVAEFFRLSLTVENWTMTMTDAVDRACTLWGFGRIVQVQLHADGAADVGVSPPADPQHIVERHHLDTHGTPTCDCCRDRRQVFRRHEP